MGEREREKVRQAEQEKERGGERLNGGKSEKVRQASERERQRGRGRERGAESLSQRNEGKKVTLNSRSFKCTTQPAYQRHQPPNE